MGDNELLSEFGAAELAATRLFVFCQDAIKVIRCCLAGIRNPKGQSRRRVQLNLQERRRAAASLSIGSSAGLFCCAPNARANSTIISGAAIGAKWPPGI